MFSQKLKALLATARIANVPSVVCNVFTGMILVTTDDKQPRWDTPTLFVTLAAVCLYISGNFFNDWHDASWDQINRPERAIPSGLFPRGLYRFIAAALGLLGFVLSVSISTSSAIVYGSIAILVYLYTVLHKQHSYSIWIMGACRAGLYLLGFATMRALSSYHNSSLEIRDIIIIYCLIIILPMLGLLCYIAGISLLARYETRSNDFSQQSNLFAVMLLMLPALTHCCILSGFQGLSGNYLLVLLCVASTIPFLIWTNLTVFRNYSVSTKVSRLLAGISLVDSVSLLSLFFVMGLNPVYAIVLPVVCFLLALLLQKIAPAT